MEQVFISSGLRMFERSEDKAEQYTKKAYQQLTAIFKKLGVDLVELEGDNIWCRDYLPVKRAHGGYVFSENSSPSILAPIKIPSVTFKPVGRRTKFSANCVLVSVLGLGVPNNPTEVCSILRG